MTRKTFESARGSGKDSNQDSKRMPLKFKDLIDKTSGLMASQNLSSICSFIKNPENDKHERAMLINSLSGAVLVPDTYDRLQGTLSKLSREDPSAAVKAACETAFNTLRDKHALPFRKAV